MARFQVQFEITHTSGTKSGVSGTTVTATSAMEAKNKVKAPARALKNPYNIMCASW